MKPRRRKLGHQQAEVGSQAFGVDPRGRPAGAAAFGGYEAQHPLKGALLFGNDPQGNPRGSEAFGGSDGAVPLKGALLFGNDPQGNPRGSEAFGGVEAATPLKGALLFGNDPRGMARGSEAFGGYEPEYQLKGSMAFGAAQLVPERLFKDDLTYDFGGVLLAADESSLAGIRKDARDRLRERVLAVLQRRLAMVPERLRHGLGEDAVPWGRLRRDRELDRGLAEALREWYRRAPGEVLGVGHARALLEEMERMHTFALRCDWDLRPVKLQVLWDDDEVAYAETALHKDQEYFVFRSPEGGVFAYVDTIEPRRKQQTARVRNADAELIGTLELHAPGLRDAVEEAAPSLGATMRDARGRPIFELEEERASPRFFRATLRDPDSKEEVGRLEDRMTSGRISTQIEVDLAMPRVLAWAVAAVMADLARLRRRGWPEVPIEEAPPEVESIGEALGPRRPRG